MICYVGECIKLARDLGSPICKIFAAWRGVTVHDGRGTYEDTHKFDQYRFWRGDRRQFVGRCDPRALAARQDCGVVLALQNHGPDIVNSAADVLALIQDVGSACVQGLPRHQHRARPGLGRARETGRRTTRARSKCTRTSTASSAAAPMARSSLLGGGYFDDTFWGRQVAYPDYVAALVESGYDGFMNWEYCHPAKRNGQHAGIEYVHEQTRMALEYMKGLRAAARQGIAATASP